MDRRAYRLRWIPIAVSVLIAAGWLVLTRSTSPTTDAGSHERDLAVQSPVSRAESQRIGAEDARAQTAPVDARGLAIAPQPTSEPAERAGDPPAALEQSLDRVAATFLSEHPDISALRSIAIQCATDAIVDEKSLRTDADGIRRGKFTVAGTKLEGSFQIEGDDFRVELPVHAPRDAGDAFIAAGLTVTASDGAQDPGHAGMTVQFHPMPVAASAPDHGERIVGWGLHRDSNGSVQIPIVMRRSPDGHGVIVGRAESAESVPLPGDWDVRANDAWLNRLRKFKSDEGR
jgi:hypothetical protein